MTWSTARPIVIADGCASVVTAPDASEIFGDRPIAAPTTRQSLQAHLEAAGVHRLTSTSTAEDVRDALEQLRAIVAGANLDDVDRATLQKLTLDTLADHRLRHVRPLVTAALGTAAPKTASSPAPLALVRDDEPYPHPVETIMVLDDTAALVRRYVALPPEAADAVALWVAGAWSIDAAQISPILAIVAASMRCGKSTLAEVVASASPRALMVASLTPAVLFRVVDECHPTLIMDEADTWLTDEKSELRGIVNAGHSRGTAVVARCVGDDNTVKLFSVFSPRVLAMIGRPPSTILDRALVVELRRKRADERVDRLRRDHLEAAAGELRRRWRRWADDHAEHLTGTDPVVPSDLNDRAADNWRHLLAIADLAGGEWPSRARRAALESAGFAAGDSESIGVELLADVRAIFDDRGDDILASADIVAALVALEARPWAEWSQGRPLTAAKLSRLLKPFGALPFDARPKPGAPTRKCYARRALSDSFARYLPEIPRQRNSANVYGPESQKTKPQQNDHVSRFESATTPTFAGPSCGVAPQTPKTDPDSVSAARAAWIAPADPWANSPRPPGSVEAAARADARLQREARR